MRRLTLIALLLASFVSATLPATAMAAPASWQSIHITLHTQEAGGAMLVTAELPATVDLPADVELSIPATVTVSWIGEILGGDPSDDPELQYTTAVEGDFATYRFTMTHSRKAQIEYPVSGVLSFDGSKYSTALRWISAQEVPSFRIGVQLPSTARITTPAEGASSQVHPLGIYYGKSLTDVKAGDEIELSFQHEMSAGAAAASGGPESSDPAPYFVLAAALIALVGFVVFRYRRSTERRPSVVETVEDAAEGSDEHVEEGPGSGSEDLASEESASEEPATPRRAHRGMRALAALGIAGLLVWAVMAVTGATSTTRFAADGTAVKIYSDKPPCLTATIQVTADEGADPADVADTLFDVLGTVPGVVKATFNSETRSLEVGFCESSASERSIRGALAPTGLVSPAQ